MALTFTDEQVAELRRLWGAMPYGASLTPLSERGQYGPGEVTAERVLRWLTELVERLSIAGDQANRDRAELFALRAQRAAVRAFFGTEGESNDTHRA